MSTDTPPSIESFDLVASDVRIDIIRALAAFRRETIGDAPFPGREDLPLALTFTELFDRVDIEDSGKFNYHLQKLLGSYVNQTADGEYQLTVAGREMAGSILSGVYAGATRDPTEIDADCPRCDSTLRAGYDEGQMLVRCDEDHRMLSAFLPTGALEDRPVTDLLDVAATRLRQDFEMIRQGVCPWCYGSMRVSVGTTDLVKGDEYGVEAGCQRCGQLYAGDFELYLVDDPAVTAFLIDHGVNPRDLYPWEIRDRATRRVTTASAGSHDLEFRLELDGEALVVPLQDHGAVGDVRRESTPE